jgi:hypothetical protein
MAALIGLGGYAFSGKDTVADLLVRNHGWAKLYMSQALEQALLALNPIIYHTPAQNGRGGFVEPAHYTRYQELHAEVGYDESKKNFEVRALLQRLGTEVGRNIIGPNVWVDIVFGEAQRLLDSGINVAVCGIRFVNELLAVQAIGGTSVWVDRGLKPVNEHVSDNTLKADDFDTMLWNRGTLADLEAAVNHFTRAVTDA